MALNTALAYQKQFQEDEVVFYQMIIKNMIIIDFDKWQS